MGILFSMGDEIVWWPNGCPIRFAEDPYWADFTRSKLRHIAGGSRQISDDPSPLNRSQFPERA